MPKYGRGVIASVLRDFLKNSYSKTQAQNLDVGGVRLNTISTAGVATFSANITVLKGQQFIAEGVTYTFQTSTTGAGATVAVLPEPAVEVNGTGTAPAPNVTIFTPL
eukprot:gene22117-28637_t